MELNSQFYIQQFYQYAGWPKYNKYNNTYSACCPICREGNSWGKKKRLYYLIDKDAICCHNCGWYSKPLKWVMEVSGKTYEEVLNDAGSVDITDSIQHEYKQQAPMETPSLPEDSINIFDSTQIQYYYQRSKIIRATVRFVTERMLHVAVNRPKALYVSMSDKVHGDRLCIPFYDNGKIVHYQTRTIIDTPEKPRPKYLSKLNSEKTIFNIDNVDTTHGGIYITEGPIDAMFIQNGVGVAGIQENRSATCLTNKQIDQLKRYPLHKKIWCLDSQHLDRASMEKSKGLLDAGKSVFIWPNDIGTKYKDFNEMCIDTKTNKIPIDIIQQNTYTGRRGLLKLATIKVKS